jgi:single-stranded-DNA-specific exonuclease
MKHQAMSLLEKMHTIDEKHLSAGVCLFEKDWHQGVIGILASRIKDRLHRPVIAFASTETGEIKGSARSIPGIHIRDVLSEIASTHPHILSQFGGHAMAAGMTIKMHDYPTFSLAFDEMVRKRLEHVDLEQKIYTDGQLTENKMTLEFTERLNHAGTWGQAFPEPMFDGVFDVIQCRIAGEQHLKFVLRLPRGELSIDAIAFFVDKPESWLGTRSIHAAYKLDINDFRGKRSVQLMLQYIEKIT